MPTTPQRQRRWPQEEWAVIRKRRPSSAALEMVAEKLREEVSARGSLHDYCKILTMRIDALELEVRDLTRKVEQTAEENTRPTLGDVGSTVSMHGSSAISSSTLHGSLTTSRSMSVSTTEFPTAASSQPAMTA